MKRRFIAAVSGLNKEDQNKFIEFLRQRGLGWWHWIDDLWLITSRRDEISAKDIRDYLRDLASSTRCIVIEIPEDKTWAGFGPAKPPRDMFEWIRNTWSID